MIKEIMSEPLTFLYLPDHDCIYDCIYLPFSTAFDCIPWSRSCPSTSGRLKSKLHREGQERAARERLTTVVPPLITKEVLTFH